MGFGLLPKDALTLGRAMSLESSDQGVSYSASAPARALSSVMLYICQVFFFVYSIFNAAHTQSHHVEVSCAPRSIYFQIKGLRDIFHSACSRRLLFYKPGNFLAWTRARKMLLSILLGQLPNCALTKISNQPITWQ